MEFTQAESNGIFAAHRRGGSANCPRCGGSVSLSRRSDSTQGPQVFDLTCGGCGGSGTVTFWTVSRDDLVVGPYRTCPGCGRETQGTAYIGHRRLVRRCTQCHRTDVEELPELRKTIIYLDQMAISEMMFAVNPASRQFQSGRADPFWRQVFEKLDRLTRLQLVVSPDSLVHLEESALSREFAALKRVYQRLSRGVTFAPPEEVERFQFQVHARSWGQGRLEEEPVLPIDDVIYGDAHGWTETFQIRAETDITEQMVTDIRAARDESNVQLRALFERWRAEKNLSFEEQFRHEIKMSGRMIAHTYARFAARQRLIAEGRAVPTSEDIFHPEEVVTFHGIANDFEGMGLDAETALKRTLEYLGSQHLDRVPSARIGALIWAAIARRASLGQKRPPTRGVVNDVRVLSAVLPFCDAIYVDNEMRSILTEEPVTSQLLVHTRVFSASNRDEFLRFLDQLLTDAAQDHLRRVAEVYGEAALESGTGMFEGGGDAD